MRRDRRILNPGAIDANLTEAPLGFSYLSSHFDGVDEYCNFGNDSSLDVASELMVSFWFKSDAVDVGGRLVTKEHGGVLTNAWLTARLNGGGMQLAVVGVSGTKYYFINNGGTETKVFDSNWHHVAFIASAVNDTLRAFVDGIEDLTPTKIVDNSFGGSLLNNATFMTAGAFLTSSSSSEHTACHIDDISLWDGYKDGYAPFTAIDVLEIFGNGRPTDLATHTRSADLIGYWQMGDGYGDSFPIIVDQIGTNDGYLTNMESPDLVNIIPEMAYPNTLSTDFDGVDERVTGSAGLTFNFTTKLTAAIWIKGGPDTSRSIMGQGQGSANLNRSWRIIGNGALDSILVILANSNGVDGVAGPGKTYVGSLTCRDNEWHLIGFTFDTNSLELYVDGYRDEGVTKSVDGYVATLHQSSADFFVGFSYADTPELHYNATMDDLTLWNAAFTDQDWADLYNFGRASNPMAHTQKANLQAYWRMGDGDVFPAINNVVDGGSNLSMTNMESGDFVTDVPS